MWCVGDAKAYEQARAVVDEPAAARRARARPLVPRRLLVVLLGLPARAARQVQPILTTPDNSRTIRSNYVYFRMML